jgi:hypothetical protein
MPLAQMQNIDDTLLLLGSRSIVSIVTTLWYPYLQFITHNQDTCDDVKEYHDREIIIIIVLM